MTAPALSEFDALVGQLMAAAPGITLEKARATIRANRPDLVRGLKLELDVELERAANVREKEEQAYIAKLFRGFGCKVYNLSQARATKQTPGLPDLWVFASDKTDSNRGGNTVHAVGFWFEVKRSSGGRVSVDQRSFQILCAQSGVRHYIGDRRTAAKVLVDIGLARVGDGPCGIVPFHDARP